MSTILNWCLITFGGFALGFTFLYDTGVVLIVLAGLATTWYGVRRLRKCT